MLCIENIMQVWKEHFARDLILIWFYSHLLKISTVKICTNWVKLCFLIKNKNFQASSTADPSGTSVSKITVNPAIVKNLIFFPIFFRTLQSCRKKAEFSDFKALINLKVSFRIFLIYELLGLFLRWKSLVTSGIEPSTIRLSFYGQLW